MKGYALVVLGLLAVAGGPAPCRAQWGWPPPGYSPTGIRACDGSQYRGLIAVRRDRLLYGTPRGWCGNGGPPPAPCAAPSAPALEILPQAPAPSGSPRP